MSIEPLGGHGDVSVGSPCSPPSTTEPLQMPRLDACEIDSAPFSHDVLDLLEGLGLFSEKSVEDESPNVSYYVENIANIMPDWHHDIEEMVVMSAKRPSILPTIIEDRHEVTLNIPSAVLIDFSLDSEDGAFGNATYRRCIRRDTGVFYALKRARTNLGSTTRERSILEALTAKSVPFVTRLKWVFQDGDQSFWVIDHFDKGSLFEYVQLHGCLDSVRSVFYASEIIAALSSLHRIGIVYQGLNPRNVMFDSEGHIVLCDFSHADFESSTEQSGMSKKSLTALISEYAAPEVILGWARNAAVDCWSFGMLVYFMLFGSDPFGKSDTANGSDYVFERIVRFPLPSDSLRFISPIARDLISKCLQRNPAVRLNMDKIKGHPYFSSVDWQTVSSRTDVPSISTPVMSLANKESQRKRLSLQAPLVADPAIDCHRSFSSSDNFQTRQSMVSIITSQKDDIAPSQTFKPALKVSVPSVVAEEDEALSESEPTKTGGNAAAQESLDWQPNKAQKAERMAHFWDTLDEDHCSVSSSQEFGELRGRTGKVRKLRKHRSSINPHLRFNFSTSSFQLKLKKKPRSTGALRDPILVPTQETVNLPNGIHQLGSGIGFTYNMPTEVPSKPSVHSFAPSCGSNFFQGGFSVKNLGRGFGIRKVKVKSTSNSSVSIVAPLPAVSDQESLVDVSARPSQLRQAGSGTLIRDMYRTPSWILSPPDSLPSPIALVTGFSDPASPQPSSEPLTPATLVDVGIEGEDHEVHVSIQKQLGLEYMSDGGLALVPPGSTLRLVPQSTAGLLFEEDVDTSLFSCVSAA